MLHLTGHSRSAGRGFTLIEILLTTVLLLLLVGAAVFSFSTLAQSSRLDEGATRLETLLRFARAHAASSGRKVRVVFDEALETNSLSLVQAVRVKWEPDPLGQPGLFQDLTEANLHAEGIQEWLLIESVAVTDSQEDLRLPNAATSGTDAEPDEFGELYPMDPVTFHPDGSSDSAVITLRSVESDNPRRIALRLVGITGAMRREAIYESAEEPASDETSSAPLTLTVITPAVTLPPPPGMAPVPVEKPAASDGAIKLERLGVKRPGSEARMK